MEYSAEEAVYRSSLYGFLAGIFRREPDTSLIETVRGEEFINILTEMGFGFADGDGFLTKPVKELEESLAVEYARLFLGPGKHISPYESVHHELPEGKWGQLWGDSTVEIKKLIDTIGLTLNAPFDGIPDHISVELEIMSTLAAKENDLFEKDDTQGVLKCLDMERYVLKEHLSQWAPQFFSKVIEEAESPFYSETAKITKDFIEYETESIADYISSME